MAPDPGFKASVHSGNIFVLGGQYYTIESALDNSSIVTDIPYLDSVYIVNAATITSGYVSYTLQEFGAVVERVIDKNNFVRSGFTHTRLYPLPTTLTRDTSKDVIGRPNLIDNNTIYNITDDDDVSLELLKKIYPVGSLYLTVNMSCPLAELFGRWSLVSQDRVLQGAGSRGTVGTTVDESLPNVTGKIFTGSSGTPPFIHTLSSGVNGAFKLSNTQQKGPAYGSTNYSSDLDFSLSYVSSTYKDNAPVQQNAYLINVFQRIA